MKTENTKSSKSSPKPGDGFVIHPEDILLSALNKKTCSLMVSMLLSKHSLQATWQVISLWGHIKDQVRVHTMLQEGKTPKLHGRMSKGKHKIQQRETKQDKSSMWMHDWGGFNPNGQQREPTEHRGQGGSDRVRSWKNNKHTDIHIKVFTVRSFQCLLTVFFVSKAIKLLKLLYFNCFIQLVNFPETDLVTISTCLGVDVQIWL